MHVQGIFGVLLIGLTLLFVLGLVLFRFLWPGSKQKKDTAKKSRS